MGKRNSYKSKTGRRELNPTDAFRKQQRNKERKRNRRERQKVRDEAQLRKNPSLIKEELAELKQEKIIGTLDAKNRLRLEHLELLWDSVKQRVEAEKSVLNDPSGDKGVPGFGTFDDFLGTSSGRAPSGRRDNDSSDEGSEDQASGSEDDGEDDAAAGGGGYRPTDNVNGHLPPYAAAAAPPPLPPGPPPATSMNDPSFFPPLPPGIPPTLDPSSDDAAANEAASEELAAALHFSDQNRSFPPNPSSVRGHSTRGPPIVTPYPPVFPSSHMPHGRPMAPQMPIHLLRLPPIRHPFALPEEVPFHGSGWTPSHVGGVSETYHPAPPASSMAFQPHPYRGPFPPGRPFPSPVHPTSPSAATRPESPTQPPPSPSAAASLSSSQGIAVFVPTRLRTQAPSHPKVSKRPLHQFPSSGSVSQVTAASTGTDRLSRITHGAVPGMKSVFGGSGTGAGADRTSTSKGEPSAGVAASKLQTKEDMDTVFAAFLKEVGDEGPR